jgi:NAD(P)-dependent dehydrogenase (short-subunit alcohol dehydrogenase family)
VSELRFDDRVAVVTGGGRGIGLAYCELLAARGARVVVNDIGTAMDGAGADGVVASQVANTLRDKGADVEFDISDISTPGGAAALVEHAVGSFGGLDIVVNNAGIFWTDSFPNVELDQVDRQLAVHVGGSFLVTRAAWPHLRDSGRGRVVLTTSSGALGSPNLTSYGTAKAAVLGLARSLAISGREAGIKVNAVAPLAMTRMMAAGMGGTPAERPTGDRDPHHVAALVALLCHDACPTSGETFNAGMQRFSRFVIAENDGYLHPGFEVAPEDVLAHWDEIMDLSHPRVITDVFDWGEKHFAMMRAHRDSAAE